MPSHLRQAAQQRRSRLMRTALEEERKQSGAIPSLAHGPARPAQLLDLQHQVGNRAVQRFINDPAAVQRTNSVIQAGRRRKRGGGPSKPPKVTTPEEEQRRKEILKKIKAGQQRRHNEQYGWFGSKTYLGMAWNWLKSPGEEEPEEEDESEPLSDTVDYESTEHEGEGQYGLGEGGLEELEDLEETLDEEEEEEDEPGPADIRNIVINLGEIGGKRQFASGSGKVGGKGEMKQNVEGIKGEGEFEFELGTSGSKKGKLGWQAGGTQFVGEGELSGFTGVKAGAKGELNLTKDSASLKGKIGAFAGGSVDVKIKLGADQFTTVKGTLGVSYGIGGEYAGKIDFKGGVLTFKGKGRIVTGLGVNFGYNVQINTREMFKQSYSLWSYLFGY